MPEALADDLRMFDDDQLRAELASLATSWPRLAILAASCGRRPCPAAVKADDPAELNAFVLAVSNRFGGHVETVLETAAANEHIAQFAVGTSQRFSPAQLVLAAPP